jgi:upstream activation factor subunit UAF30
MSASASSAAKSVKKVTKKEAAPAVAAPAPVAAPVAAAAPAKKAAKAAAAAPAAPAVVVSSTPVVQAAPAAAPAAPATTLEEDLKATLTRLLSVRDTVNELLAGVKKLDKRVHRDLKDARKRRRRAKPEEGAEGAKPRVPSIFERPVKVTDELCTFLGQPVGTLMSRSQVTKAVNVYVNEHQLKNKHDIKPDAPLKKLLAIPDGDELTYFNLQRYLNRHYVKAVPVATA